jgi:ATP-dependent DNA ligase
MTDVDVPFDTSGLNEPTTGVHSFGGGSPELFRAACRMGLEGLVSKQRDRPYQAGRSKHWVKVKNRAHPAMYRVMEALAYAP